MQKNLLLKHITILILIQVLVFNTFHFFGIFTPYVYILYIYWLPKRSDASEIIISFLIGLFIDMFLDSQGVHAASCVLISFFRPFFLRMFGYNYANKETTSSTSKQKNFYLIFLVLFHTLLVYSFEFFDLSRVPTILKHTFINSFFTLAICFIIRPFFKTT